MMRLSPAASIDRAAKLWDARTGKLEHTFPAAGRDGAGPLGDEVNVRERLRAAALGLVVAGVSDLRFKLRSRGPARIRAVIESGVTIGAGIALISWPSVTNWTYDVEQSTNLPGGFLPVLTNLPATPPQNVIATNSAACAR